MALCRFRLPDDVYNRFQNLCERENKTVSEVLKNFVATKLNEVVATNSQPVATNSHPINVVATNSQPNIPSVATNSQSVATNSHPSASGVATDRKIKRYIFNDDGEAIGEVFSF